jgi:hypothetical protein
MTGAVQLDLVPQRPRWASTWGSLTDGERVAQRTRWVEQLSPVVHAMAVRRGVEGITASDVISEAIVLGIFWGETSFIERYPRVYAWVGPWLAHLARRGRLTPKTVANPGGRPVQVTRKSERGASHANRNAIYLAPEVA